MSTMRFLRDAVYFRMPLPEAELAPPSDEPALTIVVTRVGEPDNIIEVRMDEPNGWRRHFWPQ